MKYSAKSYGLIATSVIMSIIGSGIVINMIGKDNTTSPVNTVDIATINSMIDQINSKIKELSTSTTTAVVDTTTTTVYHGGYTPTTARPVPTTIKPKPKPKPKPTTTTAATTTTVAATTTTTTIAATTTTRRENNDD